MSGVPEMPEMSGALLREPEFRQLLAWEVQRATRYQAFLTLCLVRCEPSAPSWSIAREAVAQRLVETLRASDIVGLVGDDIAVVLVHAAENETRSLAERIQRQAQEALRPGGKGAVPTEIALRLTIALFPTDGTNDNQLLAHARTGLGRLS